MRTALITLIAVAAHTSTAAAQIITGTVCDSASNTRVAAAQVMLLQVGSSQTAITDSSGKFRFEVKPGMASLRITALGYSDLQSPLLTLQKRRKGRPSGAGCDSAVEVAPIFVLAKTKRPATGLEGFYQRRRRGGFGYFMDERTIRRASLRNANKSLSPSCTRCVARQRHRTVRPP